MDRCVKCGYRYIEKAALARSCPICKTVRNIEAKDIVVKK